MRNIWTELKNVNIVNTMKLAGCMPKYTSGQASDFECFCAWLSCLPLLEGNKTAEKFAEELGRVLKRNIPVNELRHASPHGLWREYNTEKYGLEYKKISDGFLKLPVFLYSKNGSDEKFNKVVKGFDINSCLLKKIDICENIRQKQTDNGEICCTVKFFESDFLRPNGYAASAIENKMLSGEKCTSSEKNLFLTQNICDIVCQKECRKIHLYIKECGSPEYAEQLVKYFLLRGFCLRIYLGIEADMSALEVAKLCMLSNVNIFITPVLRKNACNRKTNFKKELAEIYPIALLCEEA